MGTHEENRVKSVSNGGELGLSGKFGIHSVKGRGMGGEAGTLGPGGVGGPDHPSPHLI